MYTNSYKPLLLVYLFLVGLLTACGSDDDKSTQYNRPAGDDISGELLIEDTVAVFEQNSVNLPIRVARYVEDDLSYKWRQLEGIDIKLSDYTVYDPVITTPATDEVIKAKYEFKVFNANGSKLLLTKVIDVSIIPAKNIINIPRDVGRGCPIEIDKLGPEGDTLKEVLGENHFGVSSTLEVFDENNNLLVNRDIPSSFFSFSISVPKQGNLRFVTSFKDDDGKTLKKFTQFVDVHPLLPIDIKDMDYVVNENETFFLCEDTSVWRGSSLTIKEGARLISDTRSKIKLWGNINIQGAHDNRVIIDGVNITKSPDNPVDYLVVNVNYADFNSGSRIYNTNNNVRVNIYNGRTNIYNSTFNVHYSQSTSGELKYNTFNSGITFEAGNDVNFSFNDIYCGERESHCINIWSYKERKLNNLSQLSLNNIYGAKDNSVIYNDDYVRSDSIDLSNNYWDTSLVDSLDDIFEDANDKPEKSKIFIYTPNLDSPIVHSQDDTDILLAQSGYLGFHIRSDFYGTSTLTKEYSPYYLDNDVNLNSGTLTIESGVRLIGNDYTIKLKGSLNILGEESSPVIIEQTHITLSRLSSREDKIDNIDLNYVDFSGGSFLYHSPPSLEIFGELIVRNSLFKNIPPIRLYKELNKITFEKNYFDLFGGFLVSSPDSIININNNIFNELSLSPISENDKELSVFKFRSYWGNNKASFEKLNIQKNSFLDNGSTVLTILSSFYDKEIDISKTFTFDENYWGQNGRLSMGERVLDEREDKTLFDTPIDENPLPQPHFNTPLISDFN